MKALRALVADRRRSQRGSVLSGVLIIVAFLAIISGALMTELSTNFLLARDLVERQQTQATVSSAVEVALNQFQGASLNAPCPTPNLVSVNGRTAVASVVSCAAVIDRRAPQSFTQIAASNPFRVDGTHAVLPGMDDYVVGDSRGTIYDYRVGQTAPRWTRNLGGSVTGPPLVMADPFDSRAFIYLIPASGRPCDPSPNCAVAVSDENGTQTVLCSIPTGLVATRPALSKNWSNIAFLGDVAGNVTVFDSVSTCGGNGGGSGDQDGQTNVPPGFAITQGPVVVSSTGCFRNCTDEIYFVMSQAGGNSQLARFTYSPVGGLNYVRQSALSLTYATATGMTAEPAGTRIAITFQGGGVVVAQIDGSGASSVAARTVLPPGDWAGPPHWCVCPGPVNLIGVGGYNSSNSNGFLFLLLPDANLQVYASASGLAPIRTTPTADGAGNWYVAADNGQLYEVQKASGTTMTQAATYGSAGAFRSSPVIGACQQDICLYLASTDAKAYLVDLDARDVVLTACLGTSSAGCSGANPRLWTSVEIGVTGDTQVVHVQGWSYYSPDSP